MIEGRQSTDAGKGGAQALSLLRAVPSLLAICVAAGEEPVPRAVVEEASRVATPAATAAADDALLSGAKVRIDATVPILRSSCDDAAFLAAAGRVREATERLTAALQAAGSDTPAQDRAAAKALLERLRLQADAADLRQATSERGAAQSQAQAAARRDGEGETNARRERLDRIADLQHRGHLELALAQARNLWRQLPDDAEVEGVFRKLLDQVHTARRIHTEERERELRQEVAAHIERSLLPEGHDGRPVFASDWGLRRQGHDGVLDIGERPAPWKEAILDRLAGRVDMRLEAMPAADAFNLVARLGGINMVVDPTVLAASDRTVTLKAAGMRLDNVLSWACEQAGTRWSLINGALYIGDKASEPPVVTLHDVSALLLVPPDFPGKQLALGQGTGTNGGGATFVSAVTDAKSKAVAPEDIVDLIKKTISPRTWDDAANSLVVHGTSLIVTAPDSVQRLVQEFLRAQTAQSAICVHIEMHWLTIYDRLVEEIGVQWKVAPGTLNAPPLQDTNSGGGAVLGRGDWNFDAGTSHSLPATAMSIQPATSGTGLELQSAMLGSRQLSAIFNAVERNGDGRVLVSPDIACMHGQLANCFFGTQSAYISDYEVVSSNYDPVVSVLNVGTSLEVRPLVSADRRYVTLLIRASNASVTFFTEGIGGTYIPPGQGNGVNPITGLPNPLVGVTTSFPLDLPNLQVQDLGTAAMLPDRGSLLVGGFQYSLDQFAANRVPLLGSIPFLGRLFGARGRYNDRSRLYAITTVNIINYPELEARL